MGRFLSRDPIQDGYNWYTYCQNDPVNGIDPQGLFGVKAWWNPFSWFDPEPTPAPPPNMPSSGNVPIYDGDGNVIQNVVTDGTKPKSQVVAEYWAEEEGGGGSVGEGGSSAGSGGAIGGIGTIVVGVGVGVDGARTVYGWRKRTMAAYDDLEHDQTH